MKVTLKQFHDGRMEEAIIAAEPPEETEEKPQDTPNGENKTYCLRLPQEAIDKIDTYKHILSMTAGEFVATSIQCWEENTPQIVNIVKQVKDAKKKLNI